MFCWEVTRDFWSFVSKFRWHSFCVLRISIFPCEIDQWSFWSFENSKIELFWINFRLNWKFYSKFWGYNGSYFKDEVVDLSYRVFKALPFFTDSQKIETWNEKIFKLKFWYFWLARENHNFPGSSSLILVARTASPIWSRNHDKFYKLQKCFQSSVQAGAG